MNHHLGRTHMNQIKILDPPPPSSTVREIQTHLYNKIKIWVSPSI